MYALKIVPHEGGEHGESSGEGAESLARGGRRVWRYSVQYFVCYSVWKLRSCHEFSSVTVIVYFHMVRMRSFCMCSGVVCQSLVP